MDGTRVLGEGEVIGVRLCKADTNIVVTLISMEVPCSAASIPCADDVDSVFILDGTEVWVDMWAVVHTIVYVL